MINRIIGHLISREEVRLGAGLDYVRDIATESTAGFFKLALLAPFTNHRKRLPKTAYHLAKIVVTRHAGRGSCVQIALNLATRDGVPVHYIRALLDHRNEELPVALQEVCEYAQVITEGRDSEELREKLVARYGREGLAELAFAIASAQVYPTLKRAMGHARSCSTAELEVKASRQLRDDLVLGIQTI